MNDVAYIVDCVRIEVSQNVGIEREEILTVRADLHSTHGIPAGRWSQGLLAGHLGANIEHTGVSDGKEVRLSKA